MQRPGIASGSRMSPGRFMVAAFGDAGHAFPAIGLARALAGRGHEVLVETWERWSAAVDGAIELVQRRKRGSGI